MRDGDVGDGREPPYLFVHRTFAEFLVAAHLDIEDSLVNDCLNSHLHLEPAWYQVWILLASLAPKSVLPQLVNLSSDPLHIGLSLAAVAVSELDPDTRGQKEVSDHVDALIAKCTSLLRPQADRAVRITAVDALARIGGPAAIGALRALVTELNDVGEAAAVLWRGPLTPPVGPRCANCSSTPTSTVQHPGPTRLGRTSFPTRREACCGIASPWSSATATTRRPPSCAKYDRPPP